MQPAIPVPGHAGVRLPIVVELKKGWHYEEASGSFAHGRQRFDPAEALPAGAQVTQRFPAGSIPPRTTQERELARFVQLVLPPDDVPAKYLDLVQRWPCVANAYVIPPPSLPSLPQA